MINMIQELETLLDANKLTKEDILWVGTSAFTIPIIGFLDSIREIYYDQQAGAQEVAIDLVVVGVDWFMRRSRSNDGSERWDLIKTPIKPIIEKTDITKFTIRECLDGKGFRKHNGSRYLEEINILDIPEVPKTPTPPEK